VEANEAIDNSSRTSSVIGSLGRLVETKGHDVLARAVIKAGGSDMEPDFGPARGFEIRRRAAANQLLEELTGFRPSVPMDVGLKRTIDYYRNGS